MEDIVFWVNFVATNSKNLQKLGLEGKLSWTFNVFTLPFLSFPILKMCKIKKMFTFGLTTHVTLVNF